MGIERTYTISELAKKTNIPIPTLQWLVAKGILKAARIGLGNKNGDNKRGIRIAESDYLEWWESRKQQQKDLCGADL